MRIHIGFDRLWAMQIPVPYSLFLRDGSFGWSGGQCPLDREGQVVSPGDAIAQADLVIRYCQTLLADTRFAVQDLQMAVVYHDTPDPAEILQKLRNAFGPSVVFAPVKVPAFYYPGMLVEVDLLAMSSRAGPLRFVFGTPDLLENTLVDHWIAPTGGPQLPPHALLDRSIGSTRVWAILSNTPVLESLHQHGKTTVRLRQSAQFHAMSATAPHVEGLVPQTEAIMRAFAATMAVNDLSFGDVVKSTTHYVGAATAEELHDNMAVRNRRYAHPGPASTGVRVTALADPAAKTAITLLACRT